MLTSRARAANIGWTLAILLVSASAGILVDWHASGVSRYTRDWLMRLRGPLPVPEEIAIVAIDEASMARFGRFPWSRQVIGRTIDALAASHPKVIALDVLFTDPTTQEDDDSLSRSIGHAGNVVVAAQLTDSPVHGGPSRWLLPLPAIERAAAAVGHVNVQTELEGIPRQIAVRLADDSGRSFRAMAIEAVRVADGTSEDGITDTQRALLLGSRTILLDTLPPDAVLEPAESTRVLRGGRMTIDYVGPAGSFNPVTYSLADVVAGRVSPEKIPRQVRPHRRYRRIARRTRGFAVRPLQRCARRSTWRPDARRGGAGQHAQRHSSVALLHGNIGHVGVPVGGNGRAAHADPARKRAGRARAVQTTRRC